MACALCAVQIFLLGAHLLIRGLTVRLGAIAEDDVPRLLTLTEAIDEVHSIVEEELCILMKCFLQRRQCVVANRNAMCVTPTRSEGSQSLLQIPLHSQALSIQWQIVAVSCAAVVVVSSFLRLSSCSFSSELFRDSIKCCLQRTQRVAAPHVAQPESPIRLKGSQVMSHSPLQTQSVLKHAQTSAGWASSGSEVT